MNLLNIRNFDDLKRIIQTIGVDLVKALLPALVPLLMERIPKEIKFKNPELAKTQITTILNTVVDLVDNVE